MNLDHDQVSELLPEYLRGELDTARQAAVRTHLDGCEGCRAEWAGLHALASLPPEELEPAERVALRDAVRERVASKSWSARLAPALGALGLVAIAVVGATVLVGDQGTENQLVGGGQVESAGEDAASAPQQAPAARAKDAIQDATAGTTAKNTTRAGASGAGAESQELGAAAGQTLEFAAPDSYQHAAPLGPELLIDRDATTRAVPAERRLRSLFAVAPNDSWARQIESCNEVVSTFLPEDAHPAFAAVYRADRLLVMGFIWSLGDERRYAFWGWPQGDCSVVTPVHASGTI